MRLLVTRPEPEASETAARLRALGHDPLVQPLLSIVFAEPPGELSEPRALLVTSRNGVRALATWPQAEAWRSVPLYTSGAATAEAARGAGFVDVRDGGGDSAALVQRFVGEFRPLAGPVLYVAARDRAGALAGGLLAQGYDLRTVEAYRAVPAAAFDPAVADALAGGRLDGVLLFSRRTAETFLRLAEAAGIGDRFGGVIFFVLSDAVADPLRGRVADIRVASRPELARLLALVAAAAGPT